MPAVSLMTSIFSAARPASFWSVMVAFGGNALAVNRDKDREKFSDYQDPRRTDRWLFLYLAWGCPLCSVVPITTWCPSRWSYPCPAPSPIHSLPRMESNLGSTKTDGINSAFLPHMNSTAIHVAVVFGHGEVWTSLAGSGTGPRRGSALVEREPGLRALAPAGRDAACKTPKIYEEASDTYVLVRVAIIALTRGRR